MKIKLNCWPGPLTIHPPKDGKVRITNKQDEDLVEGTDYEILDPKGDQVTSAELPIGVTVYFPQQ